MKTKKFWMVWREGSCSCTKRHETQKSAEEEAFRLAANNVGAKFFVLRTIGYAEIVQPCPTWTAIK